MLYDGDIAAATTGLSSITILGLSISDFINAVIAFLAFLGFGTSLFFSIKALNKTKEMNVQILTVLRHQNNIAMFDKRYEVFHYFKDLFINPNTFFEPLKDKQLLLHYQDKFNYLFVDTLEINLIINSLFNKTDYAIDFPDKTEEYKKRLAEINVDGTMTPEQAISYAYGFYAYDCLFKLDKQLELIED